MESDGEREREGGREREEREEKREEKREERITTIETIKVSSYEYLPNCSKGRE